jgi:hypothetical protein
MVTGRAYSRSFAFENAFRDVLFPKLYLTIPPKTVVPLRHLSGDGTGIDLGSSYRLGIKENFAGCASFASRNWICP